MAYFDDFPDILLPSFADNRNSNSDFVRSKNLFKRAKIRDDIFGETVAFEKFVISGDDRPDNVAFKAYDDADLDWVVLISNNIINVRDEWPMSQGDLERYLNNKYTPEQLREIHHYETKKVYNEATGLLMLDEGLQVDADFQIKYGNAGGTITTASNIVTSVSNYQYEVKKNDDKRKIFLLRRNMLQNIFTDMREIMRYTNSSQYIDNRTKQGDNLRIVSLR